MILSEGGPQGTSYNEATTHGNTRGDSRHPTFEPSPNLRSQLLFERTFKDKEMDIDSGKAPTSVARP